MNAPILTCARCDELLADYFEDALDLRDRAGVELHAAACRRCGDLFADLRRLRVEAGQLPLLTPSRDLWDGIAARIEAPVIPLDTGTHAVPVVRPGVRRAWMLAAAAALVVTTAGVTYEMTLRLTSAGPGAAATPATVAQAPATPPAGDAGTPPDRVVPVSAPMPVPRGASPVRLVSGTTAADAIYDREIAGLRVILDQRRAELDPKTVVVLERSLRVIDSAIAQSRAALAHDPASPFLGRQLNKALDRKVELLRTAALLPIRS